MNVYKKKRIVKSCIGIAAILIGLVSVYVTSRIAEQLAIEENKRMHLWAKATQQIITSDVGADIKFYLDIIQENDAIPVVMVDEKNKIISTMNLPNLRLSDTVKCLNYVETIKQKHEPIVIALPDNHFNYIYYDDSNVLRKLEYYPLVQLLVIAVFLAVAYMAFSSSRNEEQNRVWIGMAKETAHQLGTPISSLMAWVEILNQDEKNEVYVTEMQKDVNRLQVIAKRFSKVGSVPDLQPENLSMMVEKSVEYMRSRVSKGVSINIVDNTDKNINVLLNEDLFSWVIENILKNAVDAMSGKGGITLKINELAKSMEVLITDTGKGMHKKQFKAIFNPGYTTKERGWGLGLSLSQRIIRDYHNGKICVQSSEIGVGTTFKILLPKCDDSNVRL